METYTKMPSSEPDVSPLKVQLSPQLQPVYADYVFRLGFHEGLAKLMLANELEGNVFHSATVVLPVTALITLRELLNREEFIELEKQHKSTI